jgi:hypothetical protein
MPTRDLAVLGSEVLPAFESEVDRLRYLSSSATAGGMPLGRTPDGEDVIVDLVRPDPTRATLFCSDPWLARLIMIRAAALGVAAIVATDRPAPWEYFVNVIGGQRPLATMRTDHRSALPAPSIGSPLMIVEDARDVPQETYAPRLAWQTTLHVRSLITERSRNLLDSSDVVFVSQMPADAAATVSAGFGLGDAGTATIAALDEYDILAIADRRYQRVSVNPTATERRML